MDINISIAEQNKEILNQLKAAKAIKSNGQLNGSWLKNPTIDLSNYPGETLIEKIYLLSHEKTYCKVCGKDTKFTGSIRGYKSLCSKECELKFKSSLATGRKQTAKSIEKAKKTCLERYGVENINQLKSTVEKRQKTCLEKYGATNVLASDYGKEKSKETCLEKYGTERACQSQKVKDKISQTNIEKYGAKTCLLNNDYIERYKITHLSKLGVNHPFKSKEVREKSKKTCLERYGVENVFLLPEVNVLGREAFKEKYGADNPLQVSSMRDKCKQTWLSSYGVDNPAKAECVKNKVVETSLARYGAPYAMQNPSIRTKALGHKGMTKPEKKMNEFLTNRGFNFKYAETLTTPKGSKNFDFVIYKDDQPFIAIEIDGRYFHGLLSDSDGKHVRGESDHERFLKTPEDCKLIVADDDKVEEAFTEILRCYDISYEDWIEDIVNSLPREFPYYRYPEERMLKDWKHLCEYNTNPKQHIGQSIVKHFHPSIYHAKVGNNLSPYEAWNSKEYLEKSVRNRIIYSSNLSAHSILGGFNVCKIAPKVSVFNPSLAKYLLTKYASNYSSIFDPFSGFSGRMLGACSLGKKYIGQDISKDHVEESNNIISFLNLDAKVTQKDIFESEGEFSCLFTCSPYSAKETWNENDKDLTCDEWIDECLKRFKCERYIFIVDVTSKYKGHITEELNNSSHFGENKEKIVVIDR